MTVKPITELRAELPSGSDGPLSETNKADIQDTIDRLVADNERLRDVLKTICDLADGTCAGDEFADLSRVGEIAEAALSVALSSETSPP